MSCTRPKKDESAVKRRKRHVGSLTGKSKTCLIHGPRNSSEEFKVLGDFGTKYANSRPTKDRGGSPVLRKKLIGSRKKAPSLTTQFIKFY